MSKRIEVTEDFDHWQDLSDWLREQAAPSQEFLDSIKTRVIEHPDGSIEKIVTFDEFTAKEVPE